MTHPDKYAVGMLGLAMAGVGMLSAFVLLGVLALNEHRLPLPGRSRRGVYRFGLAVLVPLTLAAFLLAPVAVQTLAVIAQFGWDAYSAGLRVVNKHGQLCDGRFLNVFWAAAHGGGTFTLMLYSVIPVTVWFMHFNPRQEPKVAASPDGC